MDENEQRDSSTGLIIGIIVGGVVALVLIVLVAFGGYFFFTVERHAPPVVVGGPLIEEGAPEPAPPPVGPGEERAVDPTERQLIGICDAKAPEGNLNTLDFRADHLLEATAESKGKKVTASVKWHIHKGNGGEIVLWRLPMQGVVDERPIRFLDNDRFVLDGPGGGATYKRRGKE